jgi:predicted RNA-binding protein YlxR (DUF448 family)
MAGLAVKERKTDPKAPLRRCLATGARRPPAEMVRFVIDPAGQVVPDVAATLPGRGFWLSAERDMVNTATRKNLFAKAARRPVRAPADLADRVEGLLVGRCRDLIGLARRAGHAVAGFDRVEAWLRSGRAGLVLTAADGAPGAHAKVVGLARGLPVITLLRRDELGAALGRPDVVHLALAPGRMASALAMDARRLAGFRAAARETQSLGSE